MRLSIVVPALDEMVRIAGMLAALQPLRAAGHEVIVVDGGSSDGTLSLARPLADRAFVAPRGRARQMNAGAAVATGDVLLFLHADSVPAPDGISALLRELPRHRRSWGRFDIAIAGHSPMLRLVASAMNARSRLTGIATGDQGIFVTRALFDAVGGYPDQPLMEDVELSARLKRAAGRPLCLPHRLVTSGRRWESLGTWRTIFAMWWVRLLYWCGADPVRLAGVYATTADFAHPQGPPTLLIFAKEPIPGRVKTRLADALGAERAAAVYLQLVVRTLDMAVAARAAGVVGRVELWCEPNADRPLFVEWRDRYRVMLAPQRGDDLGARMRFALETALARGTPALLIGTDCPVLEVETLGRASAELVGHDAVFVPAEDGGYVLVGLARPLDVFAGIAWSTASVMAVTRAQLIALGATWRELPPLWDLDLPQDLARWEALDTRHDVARQRAVG
jgi:rSAM/selenodomain-associated transferase 2/rSAM/selenodomain-associated transferase 1